MKYGKNDHRVPANPEVHGKRKSSCNRPSHIVENNWIVLRIGRGFGNCLVNFDNKFFTKTWTLLVISIRGIIEFAFGRRSENNPQSHRAKRARVVAFISSQGMTSSGNASSSATRRSNSVRCCSVRGNVLASTQMLAQISSTSASLSSTFRRSMPKVFTETFMATSAKAVKLARVRNRWLKG